MYSLLGRDNKDSQVTLGGRARDVSMILIVAMVACMYIYIYVKTHQIIRCHYVQLLWVSYTAVES